MEPRLIVGDIFADVRGRVAFANSFDMSSIKRFYAIEHTDLNFVRAWQGHKKESKWFYCVKGSFEVRLVKVDNWEQPSKELEVLSFTLTEKISNVLYIPSGYLNGFRAMQEQSKLMVFSNFTLDESKADDYRFDENYWGKW